MPWDTPERWGTDLRGLYAQLSALRTEYRALVAGSLRFIYARGDLLVYIREHASGNVLCIFARAALPETDTGYLAGLHHESIFAQGQSLRIERSSAGELVISAEGPGVGFFKVG